MRGKVDLLDTHVARRLHRRRARPLWLGRSRRRRGTHLHQPAGVITGRLSLRTEDVQTMVYWETAHTVPNQPQFVLDWAWQWQAAERSSIPELLPSRAAHGPGSSANSIPTRSGGSRLTLSTTSRLPVLNWPRRRSGRVWSTGSRCTPGFHSWSEFVTCGCDSVVRLDVLETCNQNRVRRCRRY